MATLKIKSLQDLLRLESKKDTLFKQVLSSINTRPQLSESDRNNLAAEPILLFNVLMKLTLDNVLENLNDGALEKGYKAKYYSDKGLKFPHDKLYTTYTNVLKALDYKMHVSNQQYIEIKKDQLETIKFYKEILRDLEEYANFVQTAASDTINNCTQNASHKLTAYINELKDIRRQLSSVVIADDSRITKSMGQTLIKFTETIMTISHKVRQEINITSQNTAYKFSEHNLGFLGKILNALSKLCDMLIKTLCFMRKNIPRERIATIEGEIKRQKVIHKIQKMRF